MKPVDDKVIQAIKNRGNGSAIFTDENINTMLQNPAQWYELASSVNNENYLKIQASYVSSARYFRDKLKATRNIDLEFKGSQSIKDKSARIYARIINTGQWYQNPCIKETSPSLEGFVVYTHNQDHLDLILVCTANKYYLSLFAISIQSDIIE